MCQNIWSVITMGMGCIIDSLYYSEYNLQDLIVLHYISASLVSGLLVLCPNP